MDSILTEIIQLAAETVGAPCRIWYDPEAGMWEGELFVAPIGERDEERWTFVSPDLGYVPAMIVEELAARGHAVCYVPGQATSHRVT